MLYKFFVWKNPTCNGKNVEWIEMSSIQFYNFINQAENKERKFIKLGNEICKDADIIVLEANEIEYKKWYVEYEHQKYLHEFERTKKFISLDSLIANNDNIRIAEAVADVSKNVEDDVIRTILIEGIHKILPFLSADEIALLDVLFFKNEKNLSERRIAKKLGVSQSTFNYRKKKIIEKIKKIFAQNPF